MEAILPIVPKGASDVARVPAGKRRLARTGLAAMMLLWLADATCVAAQGTAASTSPANIPGRTGLKAEDSKPYDEKLLKLSEILGAIHYLRELCGQNDRQLWRESMRHLLEADAGSALRRQVLTRSFNNGYRSYARTYQSCTPTAQAAIGKFLLEGSQIADGLAKSVP